MPTVFISYAREDEDLAEDLYHALERAGHSAILDKKVLSKGTEFNVEIKRLIDTADSFVFLVSPEAVAQGAYARTELGFAEERWARNRSGFLPVLVRDTDQKSLPAFIRQSTWLKPLGNITAEIVAEISKHQEDPVVVPQGIMESRKLRASTYFEVSLEGREMWYRNHYGILESRYKTLQIMAIMCALFLPIMTVIAPSYFHLILQLVLCGIIIACIAISLIGSPQVKSMQYLAAAERMTREYRMYCNVAAPYTAGLGEQRAYQLFVEAVEQIILDAE